METWALEQSSCDAKTLSKLGVPPKVEVHGLLGYNLLLHEVKEDLKETLL